MEKYIVDGLVLLIFAVTVIYFSKQGFAKTVMSAAVTVGAVILARMFGGLVGQWINSSFVESNIIEIVRKGLESLSKSLSDNMTSEQLSSIIPQQLVPLLAYTNFDVESLAQTVLSGVDVNGLAQQIAIPVAAGVSEALGVVVTFFAALIGLKLAAKLVDGIFHLPILRSLNGFMGMLLGAVIGFCLCLVFANLFHAATVFLASDHPEIASFILPEGSVLYSWLLGLHL